MRIRPFALLLLAACGDQPRAAADSAPTKTSAASGAVPQPAQAEPDLPDAADPALFLDLDSLRWGTWETARPADAEARLRELGIRLVRSADPEARTAPAQPAEYDSYGENARDYHFADFSGDGVADVIYSGAWYEMRDGKFAALEGSRLKLYQVIGGHAVQVLGSPGSIQRVWKGAPGQPVSFRTVTWGCCSDPNWTVDYYRPVRHADTVTFEPYRRIAGREGIVIPRQFLAAPRRFTVANDRYLLRAAPGIDTPDANGEDWQSWEGHGNAIAEYARGARGIALAEQTDGTGRAWWFVRMDGRTAPRDAQYAPVNDDTLRMDRLGWMSSRFVTVEP